MTNPDRGVQAVLNRLTHKLEKDSLVYTSLQELRTLLNVDRVVLYYFYSQWKGQVTFEAIGDPKYSIIGSTGPDECFNAMYAEMYLAGRVKATVDIETEPISECHREFLRNLQVLANLVVPILPNGKLWGLLIAHHCQDAHIWEPADIEAMQRHSKYLTNIPSIYES
ncbi:GAF domain-containing protein [Tumidithrix elongata RA019]|uniref:GAF domain-containing protein n=1 Tax=Tumidithrix elongata BACA0141 TaxID=2716417 RepID=A0AAW9PW27_9CYAN|nr:GAF domain-containing protein [Tumidithrix elongata RA019]